MKVVFCTSGIYPESVGGIQKHSKLLIDELSKTYNDLDIYVIHPHDKLIFDDDNITEIKVHPISPSNNYFLEVIKLSKRIYEKIQPVNPDVIYAQGFTVGYKINSIKRKLIYNPHGLEPFQVETFTEHIKTWPFRLLSKYIMKRSRIVISLGGCLTDIINRHVSTDRIATLPNGVKKINHLDNKDFTDQKLKILFVGRFAANKGINYLLEAYRKLIRIDYNVELHLAGKGPLFERLKSLYSEKDIVFHGFVSDEQLIELYKSCHLFILPTLFEGMPTVVLEAMQYQLPIMVTDVGATRELVDDKNGYIINKRDSEDIKLKLQHFINLSAKQRKELGDFSRKKVLQRFTWDKIANDHHNLFCNNMIL